jgi:enoyl-CoA hydratase/carnithine racemase
MTNLLHSVREGRILRLTLNRPEKRNALDTTLCTALVEALEEAGRDPAVGAILLSGRGKAFCAGMDLQEIERDPDIATVNAVHERLFTIGSRIAKPLIAAVHGAALAGGTGLVANCHIVVAGPDALFGLTEVRHGLWPFLIYRSVAAAVGERRTLELALTGRTFEIAEAREMMLIHEFSADPVGRAREIARLISEYSPTAVQSGMAFVHKMRGMSIEEAGKLAQLTRNQVFAGEDFAEGIRAFREKRPPSWPSIPKVQR